MLAYLDSSALVKLVVREPESAALAARLAEWEERVSSVLSRVEVHRALRRIAAPTSQRRRADAVLSRIALIRLDDPILGVAIRLRPVTLRTLDAVHLATALSVRPELACVVTYDERLAAAATSAGLRVVSPGAGDDG